MPVLKSQKKIKTQIATGMPHLVTRFVDKPLMLWPPKLQQILGGEIGDRLGIDAKSAVETLKSAGFEPAEIRAGMMGARAEEREYEVIDGIAVIPISGTLLKKETWLSSFSGTASYTQIQRQLAGAVSDGGVRGILLDIDSPGGETNGCFELSDFIYSLRGSKPIYAAANDYALSAAYAIASAADKIWVTRTGAVGSIGVYALHVEQSGYDAAMGVAYTFVHFGAKKVDGNPHEPLSDRAESDIQSEVNREGEMFVATVARNRKADPKAILGTQAGLLWAQNAVPLLADEVGTVEDALQALQNVVKAGGSRMVAAVETVEISAASAAKEKEMAEGTIAVSAEGGPTAVVAESIRRCAKCSKQAAGNDKFCSSCGAQIDPEDEPDGDEEDEKPEASAVAAELQSGAILPFRTESDIQAIGNLCSLAGCPDRMAEFLTAKVDGQFITVAAVSERLNSMRVTESERTMINSHVDSNRSATTSYQALESEAMAFARQNSMTKEQAIARSLEANPDVYAAYRAQHNAKTLLATLEAAGVQFAQK